MSNSSMQWPFHGKVRYARLVPLNRIHVRSRIHNQCNTWNSTSSRLHTRCSPTPLIFPSTQNGVYIQWTGFISAEKSRRASLETRASAFGGVGSLTTLSDDNMDAYII
jgi:hypothetical protein